MKKRKFNPKKVFSLQIGSYWDPDVSFREIQNALLDLWEDSAGHLRARSIKSPLFLDYAGDALSDAKVPKGIAEEAIKWLSKGAL